jgi:putative hydrolase of the HAD superfamily
MPAPPITHAPAAEPATRRRAAKAGPDTVRGIFFDLDDTLIGYAAAERSALAAGCALAARLRPGLDPERLAGGIYAAYVSRYEYPAPGYADLGTLTARELRRRLTEDALRLLDADPTPDLLDPLLDAYEAAEAEKLKAFPDAAATLAALRPHVKIGLITNGPSSMQRGKLAALALDGYFDSIIVDTEFGLPKPDARIFAHAAATVGLPARQLLFVGNSLEADIAGANAAGWASVWMRGDGSEIGAPRRGRRAPRPDYAITHLSELLSLPPVARAIGGGPSHPVPE